MFTGLGWQDETETSDKKLEPAGGAPPVYIVVPAGSVIVNETSLS